MSLVKYGIALMTCATKKCLPASQYLITAQICNVTYKTKETVKLHVLKIVYIRYAYSVLQLTSLELNNLDRKSCAFNFQISEGEFPSVIADENSISVYRYVA
jgi:hypothetical protein